MIGTRSWLLFDILTLFPFLQPFECQLVHMWLQLLLKHSIIFDLSHLLLYLLRFRNKLLHFEDVILLFLVDDFCIILVIDDKPRI